MKIYRFFPVLLFSLISLQGKPGTQPGSYTGTFRINTGDVTLTLTMNQDQLGALTGTLGSSNGTRYALQGMVNEGIAAGLFSGSEGSLYFEAYLEGNELTVSLIEPDQFNMPDYSTARYFVMNRQNQSGSAQQTPPARTQPSAPDPAATAQPAQAAVNVRPGSERVNDDLNGYSFIKPDGWLHQQSEGQFLLGSNTIPGLMSVFPHQARSTQELTGLMQEGLQEEGVYLALEGNLQQKGSSMLTGFYSGYLQGEQARGYGIGLLSPHGGGIFVLAVSTPRQLGQEIIAAADYLAGNTRFIERRTGDSDLVRHFSGQWAWTSGYRTEWMNFYPDGSYSDQYEAAYSGNMTDGSGNITGNWGVTGQDRNMGRWSIQGDMDAGVIIVSNPDGSQNRYEYRVFVERGQKYYREYMINGYHYSKQKDY